MVTQREKSYIVHLSLLSSVLCYSLLKDVTCTEKNAKPADCKLVSIKNNCLKKIH